MYQAVGDQLGEANCIKSAGDIALHEGDAKKAEAVEGWMRVGFDGLARNCVSLVSPHSF